MIDDLLSAALLGTRGAAARLPPIANELATVLPASGSDTTTALLDAAAAATLYTRAGAKPRAGIAHPPVPCPSDRWAECSPRAADILAQALAAGWQPLVVEWLALAAAAQRHPPYDTLPKLLEAAAARRDWQPAVTAVIDERGRWLMQFNPRWQFASPTTEAPQQVWQLGNRPQRAEALRQVRESNAALARELIASTWQDDAAELRADWVGGLLPGLCDEDEPFLETCLDDRSSRVREVAADLLARLPASKFVERMTERAAPLLAYQPGAAGKLLKLKRATKATLEVTLPAQFDKVWQRDGISEKPGEKLGQKQWWLLQFLGCVPLEHWTRTWGATADEIVRAAPDDFAPLLVRGWLAALARIPAVDWIEPLLGAAATFSLNVEPSLLARVPTDKRVAVLGLLPPGDGQRHPLQLQRLLAAWPELDEPLSQSLLDAYDVPALLLTDAYFHLHLNTLARLERLLENPGAAPAERRRADQALTVIALRRDLHKEFAR